MQQMLRSALVSLSVVTCLVASDPGGPAQRWWAHVRYLADDSLEGRNTGAVGYLKAAGYVVDHFKQYGLKPAGTDGYSQPVRFDVQRVVASRSKVELKSAASLHSVELGKNVLLGNRLPQPVQIEAPLIFVGYGLNIPAANYHDFEDLDVKGKIIVYLNGGPANIAGALRASARSSQDFVTFIEGRGALGFVTLPNPKSMDSPWSRMALWASEPGMRLADRKLQDSRGLMFSATWNPEYAAELFADSGHTLGELLAMANAGKPLPRFPLNLTLKASVYTENTQVESQNLIGILPGTDPKLKEEYVVYSAHLDHVGVGEPINGDKIYNGAMDNASGIASMLDAADRLQHNHVRLKRSVLFVALCAEEKGLLGSRYFALHPTVPAKAMIADLNLDMFLPLYPLEYLVVYGADETTLGDDIKAAAAPFNIKIIPDRTPDRNTFIRSDQYNFIRAGIPAIMPTFGAPAGSEGERLRVQWLKDRYHAPSDDTQQPVDFAAVERFDDVMLALITELADADGRPQWKENSYFRKFSEGSLTPRTDDAK